MNGSILDVTIDLLHGLSIVSRNFCSQMRVGSKSITASGVIPLMKSIRDKARLVEVVWFAMHTVLLQMTALTCEW